MKVQGSKMRESEQLKWSGENGRIKNRRKERRMQKFWIRQRQEDYADRMRNGKSEIEE